MRKFEVKKMKIVRLFTFCHQSIGPSQINNKQTNKTIKELERYHWKKHVSQKLKSMKSIGQ